MSLLKLSNFLAGAIYLILWFFSSADMNTAKLKEQTMKVVFYYPLKYKMHRIKVINL